MSTKKQNKTFKFVLLAMFSALSFVVYLFEIPLGMEHLKIDLSDIIALVGAVFYGPVFGVLTELIKNLLDLVIKGIGTQLGFGNIMNFIVGCAYIVPFSLLYNGFFKKEQTGTKRKVGKYILCCAVSLCSIVLLGIGSNYIIDPLFFRYFMHIELSKETLWAAIWSATLLNVIKGVILSVASYPVIYVLKKRLSGLLRID